MRRDAGMTLLEVAVATPIALGVLGLAASVVNTSMKAATSSLHEAQEFSRIDDALGRLESLLASASQGSFEKYFQTQKNPSKHREEDFTSDWVVDWLLPVEKDEVLNALFFRTPSMGGDGFEPPEGQSPQCLFLAQSGQRDRYRVVYFNGSETVTLLDNLIDLLITVEPSCVKLVLVVPDTSDDTAHAATHPHGGKKNGPPADTTDTTDVTLGEVVPTRTFERTVLIRLP